MTFGGVTENGDRHFSNSRCQRRANVYLLRIPLQG
jgi:hypothetical protein